MVIGHKPLAGSSPQRFFVDRAASPKSVGNLDIVEQTLATRQWHPISWRSRCMTVVCAGWLVVTTLPRTKTRMFCSSCSVDVCQQIENLLFGQMIEQIVGHG